MRCNVRADQLLIIRSILSRSLCYYHYYSFNFHLINYVFSIMSDLYKILFYKFIYYYIHFKVHCFHIPLRMNALTSSLAVLLNLLTLLFSVGDLSDGTVTRYITCNLSCIILITQHTTPHYTSTLLPYSS